MQTCQFCELEASTDNTQPPMCDRHLDLAILSEYLSDKGEQVTVESVKSLLRRGYANGGSFVITAADVETLLPEMIAEAMSQ